MTFTQYYTRKELGRLIGFPSRVVKTTMGKEATQKNLHRGGGGVSLCARAHARTSVCMSVSVR